MEVAPGIDLPAHYQSGALQGEPLEASGWIAHFDDPALPSLVAEALENNRDLRATAARMRAARAGVQIASADLLPTLSADADARRFQRVLTSSSRLVGSGAGAVSRDRVNDFGLNLNLGWEVDLWGQIRNRARASGADYVASLGDYYAAELSLSANTTRAWFNAIAGESQVRLAGDTLESFQSSFNVIEGSWKKGVVTALDVRLARANVAGARAALSARQRERDAARKTLEVLLGRYPSGQLRTRTTLPELRKRIPSGLPSELLNRRPDLVAARFRLEATLQRLKAARKERLPSIRLTGSGGLSSDDLYQILDLNRLTWSIASSIGQPIFEGGRIRGEIELADARADEALHDYAQIALDAFSEVERALAAEDLLRVETAALEEAATESIAAEKLALDEYNRGLVDVITVLESQRRSFESQRSLIEIKNLFLQNRIDLYLALGGPFNSTP